MFFQSRNGENIPFVSPVVAAAVAVYVVVAVVVAVSVVAAVVVVVGSIIKKKKKWKEKWIDNLYSFEQKKIDWSDLFSVMKKKKGPIVFFVLIDSRRHIPSKNFWSAILHGGKSVR